MDPAVNARAEDSQQDFNAIASAHAGRVRLVRMNLDENLGVPSRYDVLSLPTVMLFSDGEPRETLVGPHSRGRYEKAFAPYLV